MLQTSHTWTTHGLREQFSNFGAERLAGGLETIRKGTMRIKLHVLFGVTTKDQATRNEERDPWGGST